MRLFHCQMREHSCQPGLPLFWTGDFQARIWKTVCMYSCMYICMHCLLYNSGDTLSLSAWCYHLREVSAELSRQREDSGESRSSRLWKITLAVLGERAASGQLILPSPSELYLAEPQCLCPAECGNLWEVGMWAHMPTQLWFPTSAPEVIELWYRSSAGRTLYLRLASVRAANMTSLRHVLKPSSLSSMQFICRPLLKMMR